MSGDYVYHSGILHMRWGVRRFQNPDGTYTEAGKERRRSEQKGPKERKKITFNANKVDKTKKLFDATNVLVNQAQVMTKGSKSNPKRMDLSKMTDQELRDKINRENLERQYSNLFGDKKVVTGREYANAILGVAGTVLAIGSSSLGIALAIKELKGA